MASWIAILTLFALSLGSVGFAIGMILGAPMHGIKRWGMLIGFCCLSAIRPMGDVFAALMVWSLVVQLAIWMWGRETTGWVPKDEFRFSIRTMGMLMIITAVCVSIAMRDRSAWAWQALVIGGASGVVSCLSIWTSSPSKRSKSHDAVGILGIILLGMLVSALVPVGPGQESWGKSGPSYAECFAAWCCSFLVAFWLQRSLIHLAIRARCWPHFIGHSFRDASSFGEPLLGDEGLAVVPSRNRWRVLVLGASYLGVVLLPAIVLVRLSFHPAMPKGDPIAEANFQHLIEMRDRFEVGRIERDMRRRRDKPASLKGSVQANETAYERLSQLLDLPIAPPCHSIDFFDIKALRTLCHMLEAKAMVQETTQRAIGVYQEQLGLVSALRGGLLNHALVAATLEGRIYSLIIERAPTLSPSERSQIMDIIVEHVAAREPIDDIIIRDRIYHQNVAGWQAHVSQMVDEVFDPQGESPYLKIIHVRERIVLTHLALDTYRQSHGEYPTSLEALSGLLQSEVWTDPYSTAGSPLKFFKADSKLVVYSVGADGADDLGSDMDMKLGQDSPMRVAPLPPGPYDESQ